MIPRFLHLALLTKESPQIGMLDAFKSTSGEYKVVDWMSYGPQNREELNHDIRKLAVEFQPTVTFMQLGEGDVIATDVLRDIPGTKIEWCGDCRDHLAPIYLRRAEVLDCTCFSNMRDVATVRSAGFNSEFLNIGFSPTIFKPDGPKRLRCPQIVFLGNHYGIRFPCSSRRQEMVNLMYMVYRQHFGAYGNGWHPPRGWLSEPEEASVYRTCKIAIDMNHYDDVPRFFSDRRLRIMASGAFCIANHNPGIEEDFEIGKHLVTFRQIREIPQLVNKYLRDESARFAIAKAGCQHVWAKHSWKARANDLLGIVEKYARKKMHDQYMAKIAATVVSTNYPKSCPA